MTRSQKILRILKWTAAGVLGIGLVICLGCCTLGAAGFASAGIVGGSLAASIQGAVGGAGTVFAALQSAGATGTLVSIAYTSAGVASSAAGVAVASNTY